MLLDLTFPFCCEINALVCFNHIEHPFLFPCLLPKPHFLEYNARRTTRILITLQPSNPFVCRCLVPLINLPITNKVHSLAASMSEANLSLLFVQRSWHQLRSSATSPLETIPWSQNSGSALPCVWIVIQASNGVGPANPWEVGWGPQLRPLHSKPGSPQGDLCCSWRHCWSNWHHPDGNCRTKPLFGTNTFPVS